MEFRDDEIVIEKPPNDLDALLLSLVDAFEELDIEYAVVSGYVAVLFGRSRATEDIDVLTERFDEDTADELATNLRDRGYWGSAMPLTEMYDTLADDLPFRIAEDGHRVPNVELKFVSDAADRTSLQNTITVVLDGNPIRVGSLEFQIAYKLDMGTQKDFEDAVYLYEVAERTLNTHELEKYVDRLGVGDEYERLTRT